MGLFWDLIQQGQISDAQSRASSLEDRVRMLEQQLRDTQRLLHEVIVRLEHSVGEDVNRDGNIG
jgi:hypothetical protein